MQIEILSCDWINVNIDSLSVEVQNASPANSRKVSKSLPFCCMLLSAQSRARIQINQRLDMLFEINLLLTMRDYDDQYTALHGLPCVPVSERLIILQPSIPSLRSP